MRFLLLSFLSRHVSAAAGGLDCGTADAGCFAFVTQSGCLKDLACKAAAGGDPAIVYWNDDGTDDDDCTNKNFPTKVLKGSAKTDSDGNWDPADKANYEADWGSIAVTADNAESASTNTAAELNKGYGVLFPGEQYSEAAKTAIAEISGIDDVLDEANVLCSQVARGKIATMTKTENKVTAIATPTDGDRCDGGAWKSDDAMNHVAEGSADNTKWCYPLLWEATKAAVKCGADDICDRFNEAGPCVAKNTVMAQYTKAAGTVIHCTRWNHSSAGTNDKYRHMSTDYASQKCAVGQYCNTFGGDSTDADPMCLGVADGAGNDILGTSAKTAARMAGTGTETTANSGTKWCLGVTVGAQKCNSKEVCNPHAANRDDLCIDASGAASDRFMAFGAVGAVAPTPDDTRKYCIGDNTVGAICGEKTVCNYAAGTQSDTTPGGAICIAHTALIGTIADTAAWTAAAQRKVAGDGIKFCLAKNGEAYSSKQCLTTESCNPHGATPTDTCKKTITILNHGDIAPEADATTPADSKVVCIGKQFWKACASSTDALSEACNEGAAADTDVCIDTEKLVAKEEPLTGYRVAGVENAEDQLWCFATDGAAKCGLDTVCNPAGKDGGSDHEAICADATKSVGHGEAADDAADPPLIFCLGDKGVAKLAEEDEEGFLCDQGAGKFIDPKSKMAPYSENTTPDTLEDGDVAVENCFGKDKVEKCDIGAYCNSSGTATGCSEETCTKDNICVAPESLIGQGDTWTDGGKSVCVAEDASNASDCEEAKPYCDLATGDCSETETSVDTESPDGGNEGGGASGCSAKSIAAAAVVAVLSA